MGGAGHLAPRPAPSRPFARHRPGRRLHHDARLHREPARARCRDYQEKCLRIYDAVDYAENAFNVPVVAYSGEKDPQKAAADNIEAALKAFKEPLRFTHLVAPGLEHQHAAGVAGEGGGRVRASTPRRAAASYRRSACGS